MAFEFALICVCKPADTVFSCSVVIPSPLPPSTVDHCTPPSVFVSTCPVVPPAGLLIFPSTVPDNAVRRASRPSVTDVSALVASPAVNCAVVAYPPFSRAVTRVSSPVMFVSVELTRVSIALILLAVFWSTIAPTVLSNSSVVCGFCPASPMLITIDAVSQMYEGSS